MKKTILAIVPIFLFLAFAVNQTAEAREPIAALDALPPAAETQLDAAGSPLEYKEGDFISLEAHEESFVPSEDFLKETGGIKK